jgi:hypothetical protein
MRTTELVVVFLLLLSPMSSWADTGPPDPISLDRFSPSIVDFPAKGITPGDIYDMPNMGLYQGFDFGGPGPLLHVKDVAYGLQPRQDNNDAHSNGENTQPYENRLMLYFSGDVQSAGMPGTDYDNQARLMQAAGDRFVVNGVATPPGLGPGVILPPPFGLPFYTSGAGGTPINILNANQHRYNQIPSVAPNVMNPYVSPTGGQNQDNMDALELMAFDTDGDKVQNTSIYFSLDPMSPSLGSIACPMMCSPADILLSPGPGPSNPYQWAPAFSMGLNLQGMGDDIDALAVWDLGFPGDMPQPQIDFALFSLAPGSPYLLNNGFSPADIFATNFTGMNWRYLQAAQIGMLPTDNVDAIDVEAEWMWEEEIPLDRVSPILPPPTADGDGDGDIDGQDFLLWQRGYGMLGPGLTLANGDFNREDVIVDGVDLGVWLAQYLVPVTTAVPEPSFGALLALAGVLTGIVRRR